jgi:hypothetical protein
MVMIREAAYLCYLCCVDGSIFGQMCGAAKKAEYVISR